MPSGGTTTSTQPGTGTTITGDDGTKDTSSGDGGAPDQSYNRGTGFDAGNPNVHTPPEAIVGLNSVFAYGQTMASTVGLSNQTVIGDNQQLFVNPFGLASAVGADTGAALSAMGGVLGSGVGGNLQLTIGTCTQINCGQAFNVNLGPPAMELGGTFREHAATTALVALFGVLQIAWTIIYGVETQDADRAALSVGMQVATNALLIAIMTSEIIYKQAGDASLNIIAALFFGSGLRRAIAQYEPAQITASAFGETLVAEALTLASLAPVIDENNG